MSCPGAQPATGSCRRRRCRRTGRAPRAVRRWRVATPMPPLGRKKRPSRDALHRCRGTCGSWPARSRCTSVSARGKGSSGSSISSDFGPGVDSPLYGLWRSLVSASVWGTEGRGFESRQPDRRKTTRSPLGVRGVARDGPEVLQPNPTSSSQRSRRSSADRHTEAPRRRSPVSRASRRNRPNCRRHTRRRQPRTRRETVPRYSPRDPPRGCTRLGADARRNQRLGAFPASSWSTSLAART